MCISEMYVLYVSNSSCAFQHSARRVLVLPGRLVLVVRLWGQHPVMHAILHCA